MTVAAAEKRLASRLRVQPVPWPHDGFTTELLRLFMMDEHSHTPYTAMGVTREDLAAFQVASLGDTRGSLFVAEDGSRLQGLLFVEPEIWGSVYFHRHIWSLRLVLAPDAPPDTAEILADTVLKLLDDPVDLLVADVPATNGAVLRGLHSCGFRVTACEAVGIIDPPSDKGYCPPGVSVVPMHSDHLSQSASTATTWRALNGYSSGAGFDPSGLERLYDCLLVLHLDDPDSGAIVAENCDGQVLGFAGYRREMDLEKYTTLRTASLDLLGVRPDKQANGLGEILFRYAFSLLKRERVEAVISKINVSSPAPWNSPVTMRKLGYNFAASNLILHKRSDSTLTSSCDIGYFEDSNKGSPDWRTGAIG